MNKDIEIEYVNKDNQYSDISNKIVFVLRILIEKIKLCFLLFFIIVFYYIPDMFEMLYYKGKSVVAKAKKVNSESIKIIESMYKYNIEMIKINNKGIKEICYEIIKIDYRDMYKEYCLHIDIYDKKNKHLTSNERFIKKQEDKTKKIKEMNELIELGYNEIQIAFNMSEHKRLIRSNDYLYERLKSIHHGDEEQLGILEKIRSSVFY